MLASPSPVPDGRGVYAWYVDGLPVPTDTCHVVDGTPLVYVGVAGSGWKSKSTLRTRLRQHLTPDARNSTLRTTLGSILGDALELQPVHVRRSKIHFGPAGERRLSDWMHEHARVCWIEHETPWELEPELIDAWDLPLNLEHNSEHPYHAVLRRLRKDMQAKARKGG